MTATAAVAPAAVPRATSTPEPRGASANSGQFDRQLDVAKQQQAPQKADSAKKPASAADASADAKTATAASASAAANAAASTHMAATGKSADDDAPADGDTAASALASAMLALLGPASTTLRPVAAGLAGAVARPGGGKTVAGDASAAALLTMNTAAAGAAAVATALPPGAGIMLAADDARLAFADKPGDAASQPATALALPTVHANAVQSVHQLQIPTPVGNQGFAQELGQQVAWLGGQDVKQARIRLHPEDLGQLDIKVSVMHGRVDVVFTAQHPGAVAAVQQSLPQLDQMLGQHGLSLGHAEVGQQDRGGHGGGERGTSEGAVSDEVGEIHGVAASTGSVSLLDAFA